MSALQRQWIHGVACYLARRLEVGLRTINHQLQGWPTISRHQRNLGAHQAPNDGSQPIQTIRLFASSRSIARPWILIEWTFSIFPNVSNPITDKAEELPRKRIRRHVCSRQVRPVDLPDILILRVLAIGEEVEKATCSHQGAVLKRDLLSARRAPEGDDANRKVKDLSAHMLHQEATIKRHLLSNTR